MIAPNSGEEARLYLVRANRSAIYVMLCRAVSGGLPVCDALVVVADTSDDVGRELADAAASKAGLHADDEAAQGQERGEIPTAIIVISIADAKRLFASSHPNVARGLDRQPPHGCTRVVSVSAGGAMLVHCDIRPTSPIANA